MSEAKNKISTLGMVKRFVLSGDACSGTLCQVLDRAFDHPLLEEEKAAMPLAGGILQNGYQCGQIWGAALAAGARAHQLLGAGPQAEARAIASARRLVELFRAQNEDINCLELTDTDKRSSALQLTVYFFLKGGSIRCGRMAARFAPAAVDEIGAALSGGDAETPPAPASCSAMLARRLGASDLHAVMAAGLAGGIGLSGGACGALGAAIWIMGMTSLEAGAGRLEYKAPAALDLVEQFLKCTGHEFECSEIVGRKFESVGDHAAYLREGGCSKIIEVLAAHLHYGPPSPSVHAPLL